MLLDLAQSVTQTETQEPWNLQGDISPPVPKPKREKEEKLPREFLKRAVQESYRVQPASKDEEIFRHSGWWQKRLLVMAVLKAINTSPASLERFEECGSAAYLEWSEELQAYRVSCNQCRNRHCEPCQRARAAKIAGNLRTILDREPDGKFRFITLTLKHSDEPLADQIKRLYASFKKLRKSKLWEDSQKGGAVVLEVKWNKATRKWHPHLHVIAEGDYMAKGKLSDAWLKATGDSSIVDIKILDSGRDAAHYVSKYITKGTSSEVWHDQDAATEWVSAIKGVRQCSTYGTWRGYKLLECHQAGTDWKPVCSIDKLMAAARRGDQRAVELLSQVRRGADPRKPDK